LFAISFAGEKAGERNSPAQVRLSENRGMNGGVTVTK
jgi:hypothetical protein